MAIDHPASLCTLRSSLRARTALARRTGAALVMVVSVVGLCAVLGYAMLSSAALRSRAAHNAGQVAAADALAESGVQLGMYYLRTMDEPAMASLRATGSIAVADQAVAAGAPGTFDVAVSRISRPDALGAMVPTSDYTVAATGRVGGVTQALTATVRAQHRFRVRHAMSAATALTVGAGMRLYTGAPGPGPGSYDEAVQSNAAVTFATAAIVTGNVAAPTLGLPIGYSFTGSLRAAPTAPAAPRPFTDEHPDWGDLKVYGPTYTHNGQTFTATLVAGTVSTWPSIDLATNPLGIYYADGDLRVLAASAAAASLTLPASVVVRGNLTVGADDFLETKALTLTPQPGAPGLVVRGDLTFARSRNKSLRVDGLAYVGGAVGGTHAYVGTCQLTVNGALMVAGRRAGPVDVPAVDPAFPGRVTVTFTPGSLDLPDFCRNSNQEVEGIALVGFSSPTLQQEMP